MIKETMLEKALKSTWEMDDRFHQKYKDMTMKQIVEDLEGKHFNFINEYREPCVPINLHP
jgi:hypothetical protein